MRPAFHALLLALPLAACAPDVAPAPVPGAAPARGQDGARDHEAARTAVARGEHLPLSSLLEDALRRFPGKVIDVELDDHEYEIEILGRDGLVHELEYDARSGALLEVETDDD